MSRPFAAAIAGAALVATLACGSAAAVDAVAGTQLVMHVGPSAGHRSVATIPAESRVTVHGCSEAEGWCLVRFAGRHGWVEGESLQVLGFSRGSEPASPPPARQAVVVPEPVVPQLPHRRFVSAEDVIVGVGEDFGLAVAAGRTRLDLKKRHGGGLAFERHRFEHKARFRTHGHFSRPHLDRRGFHSGKRFGHLHFGKAGGGSRDNFHRHRAHIAKHGHFAAPGKGAHHARHFGRRHAPWHVAAPGKSFRHSGKVRFGGFRLKGGWRP
ncbi:MAG TPA: SH3 domain-containing protein [Afifellaceae bacterium]|nr:SH3 domain-containing protein [Afifellaceae bacterium]